MTNQWLCCGAVRQGYYPASPLLLLARANMVSSLFWWWWWGGFNVRSFDVCLCRGRRVIESPGLGGDPVSLAPHLLLHVVAFHRTASLLACVRACVRA